MIEMTWASRAGIGSRRTPPRSPSSRDSRYRIDGISIPAGEFTGDFYFTHEVNETIWFALGDVAGKGLDAAIFMSMIQEELERLTRSCFSADPAELVAVIDRELRGVFPINKFATLVVGRIDSKGGLQIVNAGHCCPVLYRESGEIVTIGSNGPVIGMLPCGSWRQDSVVMNRGDVLVLYSDGLLEAQSAEGEEFGPDRIISTILAASAETVVDELLSQANEFSGGFRHDDLTIFALSLAR